MGINRLYLWSVLLIPLFCTASDDSAVLSYILSTTEGIADHVSSIETHVSSQSGDLAYLEELYDIAQDTARIRDYTYYLRYQGLRSITNALWGIFDKIETDYQHHYIGNTDTSYMSIYTHDVRTDDIYSRLGDIQQSINNLTNYLCYSPEYVAGASAIYTNFPALFAYVSDIPANYSRLYYYLTGNSNPTSQDLSHFKSLVTDYGFSNWLVLYSLLGLDYYALPADLQYAIDSSYQYPYPYGFDDAVIEGISESKNYLFGTRELTDTSIGISNLVATISDTTIGISNILANITNNLYDASFAPSGIDGNFADGVVKSVGQGAEQLDHFSDSPETNIVGSVLTGAITSLSDANYSKAIEDTSRLEASDFTDLDEAISELNALSSYADDITTSLDNFDTTDDFVFEIDYQFLQSGLQTATIRVPNLRRVETRSGSTLDQMFTTVANIIKYMMFLTFFARGWSSLSRHCYQMGYLPI